MTSIWFLVANDPDGGLAFLGAFASAEDAWAVAATLPGFRLDDDGDCWWDSLSGRLAVERVPFGVLDEPSVVKCRKPTEAAA